MKKLIRNTAAVFAGLLVFFGTSVIAANLPAKPNEPKTDEQPGFAAGNKSISLEDGTDSHVQLRSSLTLPKITASPAPSSTPAATPFAFADISTADLRETYQHIEEGTYQSGEENSYQFIGESIYSFSERDKILIARVVYSEARGEIFEGQVAVATVVLNRYNSGLFGRSIAKIVFAPNQFAITEKYNSSGMAAVEDAIERMGDYPENMFFFQVSKNRTWRNFVYYKRIGNHSFYCAAK